MLPAVRRLFIDGNLGQIHTRAVIPDKADRPAIVCLHMSPKSSATYVDVMPHLASRRAVIAADFPGHGESDLPPAEPHVNVADFAETVWSVIEAYATGPVHLVGYHTGAMVAVEAASQRPEQIRSIVSIAAPVFTADERTSLDSLFSPIPIDEEGSRFRIMWERVLQHRGPGMTLQMAAASFAENLRAGDDYEWGHRAAFAYAETYNQRLGEIEKPMFVINPNDDCFEQSKRADNIMKNGVRRDFPDWGHGFLNAYPEQAAAEILSFIESHEEND